MQPRSYRTALCALLLVVPAFTAATAQQTRAHRPVSAIPANVLLPIVRAEDERRWDKDLAFLLTDKNAPVRKRAALAAGRIGDERAVPALVELLRKDREDDVRQMAAFALGEIESALAADALIEAARADQIPYVRARALEALGKIAAALPPTDEARRQAIGQVILDALITERQAPVTASGVANLEVELFGFTAALRARPKDAGRVLALYLLSADWRVCADALNALARLRSKDGNGEARKMVVDHSNPIVRANAARVLGATEDKQAFDALLDRALHDEDLRVRVSAIRALGSLKDERAAIQLSRRGSELFRVAHLTRGNGVARNEGLEILSALGLILMGKPREDTGPRVAAIMELGLRVRAMTNENLLEDEVALAREDPEQYLDYLKGFESAAALPSNHDLSRTFYGWRSIAARAAGLGELGRVKPLPSSKVIEGSQLELRRMLNDRRTPITAVPNILNAYAVSKPKDLSELLPKYLANRDVIVRATAAELLGEQSPDEANARALIAALPVALRDKDLNDAALAILDALAKQKTKEANEAIKTALDSSDHPIRRRAVALLKANGVGDFSNRIGTVKTRNTDADYRRAIARIGKQVTATVVTSKGSFVIEFLPEDAPLTLDNFVQLARKGYFNGITFHRVVPNFVIQGGDPRGDGNGGPGYSIRCEINEVPYERAAVGMALSGKDTGGSQWFVTHARQPHLDGGYTVFGRVIRGMDVVDRIARGDTIRRVIVSEHN